MDRKNLLSFGNTLLISGSIMAASGILVLPFIGFLAIIAGFGISIYCLLDQKNQ
ncbi:MAG: hypothetical protein PHY23_06395 [Oscillospiraceae bacterium]|jgi:hypothetical protein|nr:hypothetical protein [Oscillospiraceae bacterium]